MWHLRGQVLPTEKTDPEPNPQPETNSRTLHVLWPHLSSHWHDIVNLHDHLDTLSRQRDGTGGDQQGLQDVLLEHVGDAPLLDIDTGVLLTPRMQPPELSA